MKKLIIAFSLLTCMILSVNDGTIYACESESSANESHIEGYELTIENGRMIYTITDAEAKKQIDESIKNIQSRIDRGRVPTYEYDYVYGTKTYPSKSGVMGNQSPGGLKTDGGIWWTGEGGPTSSISVSFSTGAVSVGISFGSVVSSGVGGGFLRFPDAVNYYRAYNNKTLQVQQVSVYGTPVGGGSRRFLYYIYPSSTYRNEVYAVRQNS